MSRSLLVPLDGRSLAEAALPMARTLADALHANLSLLRVVRSRADGAAAEQYLAGIRATLERDGYRATADVVTGEPAGHIARMAAHARADFVVMATHARDGVWRMTEGSIAERVIALSPVPVLLVR